MLQRLYVDNYKCLVNFDLPLRELSLLLGPNGAGKTSVLDIVFALRRILGEGARITDADVFPTRTLTRWQQRNLQVFEIQAMLDTDSFGYRLEVEHERSTRRARIRLERLTGNGGPLFEFSQGEVRLYRDNHSEGPSYHSDWSESALVRVAPRPDNTRLTRFMDFMGNVMVCGLYQGGENGLLLQREKSGVVTTRKPEAKEMEDGLKLSELIARGWNGRAGMCESFCCARTRSTRLSGDASSRGWDGRTTS